MIMDQNSSFQQEGLYPFAITGNGTILAFANNPAIVGINQLGSLNSYGMSFVREGISLGKSGGGMYTLAWDSGKQKEVFVLDYVEPAGNDGQLMILMSSHTPALRCCWKSASVPCQNHLCGYKSWIGHQTHGQRNLSGDRPDQ